MEKINLLVTLDKAYVRQLNSLLRSINDSNEAPLDIYAISNDLSDDDLIALTASGKNTFHIVRFDEALLANAPATKRYPLSVYYRIFAAQVLPSSLKRVLYLDPDIIVKGDLTALYNTDFCGNYFIATTNIREFLRKFNELKNDAPKNAPYVNTGVMLINLELLRSEQKMDDVFDYIRKHAERFTLPDQDVISALYGEKIGLIDHLVYNMNDRAIRFYNLRHIKKIDLEWVEKNTVIIHYYGKNKPWKDNYVGILKGYYDKYGSEE